MRSSENRNYRLHGATERDGHTEVEREQNEFPAKDIINTGYRRARERVFVSIVTEWHNMVTYSL